MRKNQLPQNNFICTSQADISEFSEMNSRCFTVDYTLWYACARISSEKIGDLYKLAIVDPERLKSLGTRMLSRLEKALVQYLNRRDELKQSLEKFKFDSHHQMAAEICASLYLKKIRSNSLPLNPTPSFGSPDPALWVFLEQADLFHLLKRTNFIYPDGLTARTKDQFLKQVPAESFVQAEIELYKIAQHLLPIAEWDKALWNKFVPSWVLNRKISSYTISSSLLFICKKHQLETYHDLLDRCTGPLISYSGIGRKTERQIFAEIDKFVMADAPIEKLSFNEFRQISLIARLKEASLNFGDRGRYGQFLQLRLGLNAASPLSMKEIGNIFQVTRERVAQIEKRTMKEFIYLNRRLVTEILSSAEGRQQNPANKVWKSTDPWLQSISDDVLAILVKLLVKARPPEQEPPSDADNN